MGKEKIEEKDVRLLRYAVEQAFDGKEVQEKDAANKEALS